MFDDLIEAAKPEAALWQDDYPRDVSYDSSIHVVTGLISASAGGGSFGGGFLIRHITLAAWRVDRDVIQRSELTAFERTTDRSDSPEQTDNPAIRAYAIVRMSVRLERKNGRAVVVGPIESVRDDELAAIGRELQQQVAVTDPILGRLVLDRSLNRFGGFSLWRGHKIRFDVDSVDDQPRADAIELAHAVLAAEQTWASRVDETCMADLYDLANDWKRDGDDESFEDQPDPDDAFTPWTQAEFLDRITPTSISFRSNGFDIYHDDGDLFWGHYIVFDTNADGSTRRANIAG